MKKQKLIIATLATCVLSASAIPAFSASATGDGADTSKTSGSGIILPIVVLVLCGLILGFVAWTNNRDKNK